MSANRANRQRRQSSPSLFDTDSDGYETLSSSSTLSARLGRDSIDDGNAASNTSISSNLRSLVSSRDRHHDENSNSSQFNTAFASFPTSPSSSNTASADSSSTASHRPDWAALLESFVEQHASASLFFRIALLLLVPMAGKQIGTFVARRWLGWRFGRYVI